MGTTLDARRFGNRGSGVGSVPGEDPHMPSSPQRRRHGLRGHERMAAGIAAFCLKKPAARQREREREERDRKTD